MSWSTLQDSVTLAFNGIELTGSIEHDPAQNALEMLFPDGDREVLTVDLLASGYVTFPGEVFVRDYSEHTGLPAALVAAGVCDEVEKLSVGPFGSDARRMRVIAAGWDTETPGPGGLGVSCLSSVKAPHPRSPDPRIGDAQQVESAGKRASISSKELHLNGETPLHRP
ncbi:MAG: hypothetical protein WDA07_02775 [Leucobacter sp.]